MSVTEQFAENRALKQHRISTPNNLFRQQALENARLGQYGTVVLTSAISHTFLNVFFLTLIMLLIMFFAFFEITRKAAITGILVPTAGVIRVVSGQSGAIKEVRVKEGQIVRKGEILFIVSSERSSSDLHSTEVLVSESMARRRKIFQIELQQAKIQASYRSAALRQRVQDLQSEIKRLDEQKLIQSQRIVMSQQTVARFVQLKETSFISTAQLQEKEAELLDQRQRLLEIERIASTIRRDLNSAQADERDITVQAMREQNDLHRNILALEQDLTENEARREIPVRARQSGTITTIAVNIGQTISNVTLLASILPEQSKLEAEMYVPSRAVGFIKPGMATLLRYQAFPYQKFGQHSARVREIGATSVRLNELPNSAAAMFGANQSEPVYRIQLDLDQQTVKAYGTALPLRSGMLVDANVLLERRKVYEWVLEPLFSISGRL